MTPSWPQERTDSLIVLWDEGHSATIIGEKLGITRNAVLGKAHRLDLPERAPTPTRFIPGYVKPVLTLVPKRTPIEWAQKSNRPAAVGFVAPRRMAGQSKTAPAYRNQLARLPEMTPNERRAMLAQIFRNTAEISA